MRGAGAGEFRRAEADDAVLALEIDADARRDVARGLANDGDGDGLAAAAVLSALAAAAQAQSQAATREIAAREAMVASERAQMARELESRVREIQGVTVVRPVQANAVFAIIPPAATVRLQERFRFYVWDEQTGQVRLMCGWDTTPEDVDALITAVRGIL